MKRKKTMLILVIVLVVIIAGIFIEKAVQNHIDKVNTVDETIVSVNGDDVTTVSWEKDGETLSFVKTDGTWYNEGDEEFPVDQDAIAQFLELFSDLHASFIIEDVEDYDQYGLKDPSATIVIHVGEVSGEKTAVSATETSADATGNASADASGNASGDAASDSAENDSNTTTALYSEDGDIVISLGGYSTIDEKRYVTLGDGTVYLIDDDFLDDITTDRDDFIQNDQVGEMEQVTALTVSGAADFEVAYEEPAEEEDTDADGKTDASSAAGEDYSYYYVSDGKHLPLSTSLVNTYLANVTDMEYEGYETYSATDADLAEYGLDTPSLTITLTGDEYVDADSDADSEDASEDDSAEDGETEQKTYTIYFGYIPGENDDEDGTAYVMFDGSTIIYSIDPEVYKNLAAGSYASLRPTEVVKLDWDEATQYSAVVEGSTYTVNINPGAEDLTQDEEEDATGDSEEETSKYMMNGKKVDFAATVQDVNDLSLSSAEVGEIDTSKQGTLEFSFTIDQGEDTYTVCMYRYDGDDCIVTLNGETIGLVSRADMVELREDMFKILL